MQCGFSVLRCIDNWKIYENNLYYDIIFCLLEVFIFLYMVMLGMFGIGIYFVVLSLELFLFVIGLNDVIKVWYMFVIVFLL